MAWQRVPVPVSERYGRRPGLLLVILATRAQLAAAAAVTVAVLVCVSSVPLWHRPGVAEPSSTSLYVLVVGVDYTEEQWPHRRFADIPGEQLRSRSDLILLVHLEPASKFIGVLSIPRDTLVTYGGRRDKINHTFASGGVTALRNAVGILTGIQPQRWVIVDFQGFKKAIDCLGGVTIDVEEDLGSPGGGVWLSRGTHRLNGDLALSYVRHRAGDPYGDVGRIKRQQQLLKALLTHISGAGLARLFELVRMTPNVIKTNLALEELYLVGWRFMPVDASRLRFFVVPGRHEPPHHWKPDMVTLRTRVLPAFVDPAGWAMPGASRPAGRASPATPPRLPRS